jgi:hypothetical protein
MYKKKELLAIVVVFIVLFNCCGCVQRLPPDLQTIKDAVNKQKKDLDEKEQKSSSISDYKKLVSGFKELKEDIVSYTIECNRRGVDENNEYSLEKIDDKIKKYERLVDITNMEENIGSKELGSSHSITTQNNQENKSLEIINDLGSFILKQSYTLNGSGSVIFYSNGEIVIKGGRATLRGLYEVIDNDKIRITGLQAVDGIFDASNNRSSYGLLYLNSEGSLSGLLTDGASRRQYTFLPK